MNEVNKKLSTDDCNILNEIQSLTVLYNKDNLTRTEAYFRFYEKHPEIRWSFLASMVSRNAGWNMCDLEGDWFPKVLSKELRHRLFMTYERANWLIFSDAFPQLCLYERSKFENRDLSYLLPYLHVSTFMQDAWRHFYKNKEKQLLLFSLIINEQNLIQRPVIDHPLYRKKVFKTWLFLLQDWFHFSSVLFPTRSGQLYGCSVHDFRKMTCRIDLGKKLAEILFHPMLYQKFLDFSKSVSHTGSRHDYEQFVYQNKEKDTPFLSEAFPIISHHRQDYIGWSCTGKELEVWIKPTKVPKKILISKWYSKKQKQIHTGIALEAFIKRLFT
ncbi:DUF2515 family protein [Bacillus sp. DJP31]|uniref:DUF2515 family protein n=1 Tax=Bacillus sp. DJP31 TaxID=3409789 RepID=UPI003BB7A8A0